MIRVFLLGLLLLPAFALADGNAMASPTTPSAYRSLGVSPDATVDQIKDAFKRLSAGADRDDKKQSQVIISYLILSNPEARKQYDRGTPPDKIELQLSPEERAQYAEILRSYDPVASSKLESTGRLAVSTASEMLTFYFSTAILDFWDCAKTRDSTLCKQFLRSLKSFSGNLGFVLFMGASNLTAKGIQLLGIGASVEFVADNLGMAVGGLASSLFTEIWNRPEAKEYLKARTIQDPKARKEIQDQAKHSLWAETFGKKEWRLDHVPTLGSMVGGAVASGLSWQAGAYGIDKLATKASDLAIENHSRVLSCIAVGLRKVQAIPAWPTTVAKLITFQRFQSFLESPVNWGWKKVTLDSDLRQSRADLSSRDVAKMEPRALEQMLSENARLWDDTRRKKMRPMEEIMARHENELGQLEQAINKPYLFYTWFMDGMRPESDAFTHLKEFYYGPNATPEKLRGDTEKYLRGFFCGPDVNHAFHDSRDLHGIPIVMNVSVDPFRIPEKADPAMCMMGFDQLKEQLKKKDYQEELRETYANFQAVADGPRVAKIRFYEGLVQTPLVKLLRQSVLPDFDSELADLTALKPRAFGTPAAIPIDQAIENLKTKQKAAQYLLTYMESSADRRAPPPITPESLLGAVDPSMSETSKVTRYFDDYIIQ